MLFRYSDELINQFPMTVGGLISVQGVTNGEASASLQNAYADAQQAVIAKIGDTPLSDLPSLNAWRQTFRQFGVNPTKTRSAPEALLRRLTKQGNIPPINTLVDIGNLVSIRYALPVAIFDTQHVQGTVTVDFAKGTERFTQLGQDTPVPPEAGEVVFADKTGMVIANRWCWRQSAESAAQAKTTNALICIEAQHEGGLEDVQNGLEDLLQLLKEHAGGEFRSSILSRETGLSF